MFDKEDVSDKNVRKNLLLFDVDGTLCKSMNQIENDVHLRLQELRKEYFVGLVGGSNIEKIAWQTIPPLQRQDSLDPIKLCINNFDYVCSENGLVSYKQGQLISKQSLINHLGETTTQKFINFCLCYMSKLILPAKRGNFIEFRSGMINICPVGRSCSQEEREEFNDYDKKHSIREKFIDELKREFGPETPNSMDLQYSIGGQISFDVFPSGWDKRFCLNLIDKGHDIIHFFGDRTEPGGNDYEIYVDPRVIGHSVQSPANTMELLSKF